MSSHLAVSMTISGNGLGKCHWNRAYDLIEFVTREYAANDENMRHSERIPRVASYATLRHSELDDFRDEINDTLEREHTGYRLVETLVSAITNNSELDTIEQAPQTSDKFGTARNHMCKTLELFPSVRIQTT